MGVGQAVERLVRQSWDAKDGRHGEFLGFRLELQGWYFSWGLKYVLEAIVDGLAQT